jgi:hypothetical protein
MLKYNRSVELFVLLFPSSSGHCDRFRFKVLPSIRSGFPYFYVYIAVHLNLPLSLWFTFASFGYSDFAFAKAIATYEALRQMAGKLDLNDALLARARRIANIAVATNFEGTCVLMLSQANGLGKRKKYQTLTNDFLDTKCPTDFVLAPLWKLAQELGGADKQVVAQSVAGAASASPSAVVPAPAAS